MQEFREVIQHIPQAMLEKLTERFKMHLQQCVDNQGHPRFFNKMEKRKIFVNKNVGFIYSISWEVGFATLFINKNMK